MEVVAQARAALALALVLVVAAGAGAAGGAASAGAGGAPGLGAPGWAGSVVVAFVGGAGTLLAYGLVLSLLRSRPRRRRAAPKKTPWWVWLVEAMAAALAAALLLGLVDLVAHHPARGAQPLASGVSRVPAGTLGHVVGGSGSPTGWLPVVVGMGVALAAATAYQLFAHRRKAKLAPMAKLASECEGMDQRRREAVAALDLSLQALWAEPDPRRAVIAAYARMDSWLAHAGMGRRSSEAPFEHLDRVVSWLGASGPVGATLAGLFERAKFDRRPCGQEMKEEALGALVQLRSELAGPGGVAQA